MSSFGTENGHAITPGDKFEFNSMFGFDTTTNTEMILLLVDSLIGDQQET